MISKLFEKLKRYLEIQVSIAKLSLVEQIAVVMAFVMFIALCTVFFIVILIILGIALSQHLANSLASSMLGYSVAIAIYIVVLLLTFTFKKQIINFFTEMLIKVISDAESKANENKNIDD